MRIAMIGLGRMGGNMTRRLCRRGIEVVGYNRSREVVEQLQREEGMIAADSVLDAVEETLCAAGDMADAAGRQCHRAAD